MILIFYDIFYLTRILLVHLVYFFGNRPEGLRPDTSTLQSTVFLPKAGLTPIPWFYLPKSLRESFYLLEL
jgi:hypothetical protein